MQEKPVFTTLRQGRFIQQHNAVLLSEHCRDAQVKVFQDSVSGVIYLDPHYNGREQDYYINKVIPSSPIPRNDMDIADTLRRSALLRPYLANKRWLDFGCGPGYQLRHDSSLAKAHLGLELNSANLMALQQDGYQVADQLTSAESFQPELISLFHVLEHLDDPVSSLHNISQSASPQARLIVEVPHGRDWLVQNGPTVFRDFTFWSEHLVLHTRESLRYLLEQAGWQVEQVCAVQRYPVWNHLAWFKQGQPTGLGATLAEPTSLALHQAYEAYLAARDQTDTLLALARRKAVYDY